MTDCQHWIPVMLEAETAERRKLERENERLRRILTDIRELTADVEKPKTDWMSLMLKGHPVSSLSQQQAAYEAERRQQSMADGLLGGFGWPWC